MDSQRVQFLEEAAITFAVLGVLLYEEPSRERLESLLEEQFFSEVPFARDTQGIAEGIGLLESWSAQAATKNEQELVDELSLEWFKLFVGPGDPIAAPWASYYLERDPILFSKQTLGVRQHYANHGLELEHKYNEPDDHLGLMLQFLSVLVSKEYEALKSGDNELAVALSEEEHVFVRTYISPWIQAWQQRVSASSVGPFYQGLAILAGEIITLFAQRPDFDNRGRKPV